MTAAREHDKSQADGPDGPRHSCDLVAPFGGSPEAGNGLAIFSRVLRSKAAISLSFQMQGIPLAITVTQKTDEITVCNQGPVSLGLNPTVRINGEYLIHLKGIREGGCATARKTSFISPDWKHLPAPRELPGTEVEVLSQASGLGYTKQEFSPRIAD